MENITIKAIEHGIVPNSDITVKWIELLTKMQTMQGKKTIVLEKGQYTINSKNAVRPMLYITNTMSDKEWMPNTIPHENCVATYINNTSDLTIEGNNSVFVMVGQMTNIAIQNSKNITINNLQLSVENPDMHEFKVISKGLMHIDFELDSESKYIIKNNKFYFEGQDYCSEFLDSVVKAHWIGKIPAENSASLWRVGHPLLGSYKIKELGNNKIRVNYIFKPITKVGDAFYLFDVHRKYQGVFGEDSENIKLHGIEQNFNYGLALVFQNCTNVTIEESRFCPAKNGAKKLASVADFIQICMCRGQVDIKNNFFEGAGDDCLNVHGVHYELTNIKDNVMHAKFCHCQSHGFVPFKEGDALRYIDKESLMPNEFTNTVKSAKLLDKYTIEIITNEKIQANASMVLENATACPNLDFVGNTLTRIITRGILITTSGKVNILNNNFANTSMHSILLSDDAKNWYESGFVRDVLIENNTFGRCIGYTVQIKPENSVHKGYVHQNIVVKNNTIDSNGQGGFYVKSADKVVIENNTIKGKTKKFHCKNSNVSYK